MNKGQGAGGGGGGVVGGYLWILYKSVEEQALLVLSPRPHLVLSQELCHGVLHQRIEVEERLEGSLSLADAHHRTLHTNHAPLQTQTF